METTNLNIYNIDAAVLVLHKLTPGPETIRRWRNSGIKILVLCLDEGHAKKLSDYLEGLTDGIHLLPQYGTKRNNRSTSILKEKVNKLGAGLKKTILLADLPTSISKMKPAGIAMSAGLRNNEINNKAFYDKGADIVLAGIDNIIIEKDEGGSMRFSQTIPGIFEHFERFTDSLKNKKPVFFFDYDGTLTPIINDPERGAVCPDGTKSLLI